MQHKHFWSRQIALVDMNAFFASIEQRDHPEWQARPVVITNGTLGSTIITSSYEARAYGIKTGMRLKEAQKLCPHLVRAPTRPQVYAQASIAIMEALEYHVCPDIEVFSIDECFLDLTQSQRLFGSPDAVGQLIKKTVNDAANVLCSVGISGDKTTAKYAAKLNKPDGLTIIAPWDAEAALRDAPVTELCGINKGIGRYLNDRGVFTCDDMKKLPISELTRRFGHPGNRIWLMAQGKDPDPLFYDIPDPKSIGHGKVIPPDTSDKETILTYYQHMSEKVAYRLRKHQLRAKSFFIAMRTKESWFKDIKKTGTTTDDGQQIYQLCKAFLDSYWYGEGVYQVQVTAKNPVPSHGQIELFVSYDIKKDATNKVMDAVNQRYGGYTLTPAKLINKSEMPDVIAPAWKPSGHRQTIGE